MLSVSIAAFEMPAVFLYQQLTGIHRGGRGVVMCILSVLCISAAILYIIIVYV